MLDGDIVLRVRCSVDGAVERWPGLPTVIHVLHVVPILGLGGVELTLARVIRALAPPDFRHSVACLTGDATIASRFDAAVGIHCLRGEAGTAAELARLRWLIRTQRPSLIHARNVSAWIDVALARLSVARRPPLVLSFHGRDHTGTVGWRTRVLAALAARSAARIFTVSEGPRDLLVRVLRLPPGRIDVIPNGVDTVRFSPRPRPEETPRLVVGTVGNLLPVKNQALLIRACAALAADGQAIELRIAGEGPERSALSRLAATLPAGMPVRLLGHVDDIPAFLNQLDLFVLPSATEAHPNALIEAMACGLPCIASRVGGIPDVVADESMGRLFDAGDLPALIAAMRELLAAPDIRAALGRGARKRVEARYAFDDMVRRYAQLYTEVAAR